MVRGGVKDVVEYRAYSITPGDSERAGADPAVEDEDGTARTRCWFKIAEAAGGRCARISRGRGRFSFADTADCLPPATLSSTASRSFVVSRISPPCPPPEVY